MPLSEDKSNYAQQSSGGRIFLMDLYFLIGDEILSDIYEELYKKYLSKGERIDEYDIEQTILKHTPFAKKDRVLQLINERLWGEGKYCKEDGFFLSFKQ
ncbi:MAG: hypothetical protein B6U87_02020 [Candidatus Aenigmarchaeota archaeon ex4484_52]|nr:MAG: hypothetical protein B6U87_02020 [Candidatus Aenigmarchaeota archaeon ex4484_52]